jgi:hypothetical protein
MKTESKRSLTSWIVNIAATAPLVILMIYTCIMSFDKIHGVPVVIKAMIVAIVIAHGVGSGVSVATMASNGLSRPFTRAEFSTMSRLAVAEILLVIASMILIYTPSSSYGLITLITGMGGWGILAAALWSKKPTIPSIKNQQS